MCGIYGLIFHHGSNCGSKVGDRLRTFINVLALTAADRGTDATGIAHVMDDGKISIYKDTVPSYRMVRRQLWLDRLDMLQDFNVHAVLGHTRRKSHGENTHENAHPFILEGPSGALVGTHNGVINNHLQLVPTGVSSLPVDSANLFSALAQHDTVTRWCDVLERVQGNFALAMSRQGTVYLARNAGSPCYVAYVPLFGATVYGSVAHMLYSAASMAGVQLENVHSMKNARIYAFVLGRKRPTTFYFKDTYKEYVAQLTAQYSEWDGYSAYGTYQSAGTTQQGGAQTSATTVNTRYRGSKHYVCSQCKNFFHFEEVAQTPSGRLMCNWCCAPEYRGQGVSDNTARRTRQNILQFAREHGGITAETAMRIQAETIRMGD